MEHFTTICEVLKDYLSDTILPNPVELMGIYGRVSFPLVHPVLAFSFTLVIQY